MTNGHFRAAGKFPRQNLGFCPGSLEKTPMPSFGPRVAPRLAEKPCAWISKDKARKESRLFRGEASRLSFFMPTRRGCEKHPIGAMQRMLSWGVLCLAIGVGLSLAAGAQTPTGRAGAVAQSLQTAVTDLQQAVSNLDPDMLEVKKAQRAAIAEGKASISRNLSDAVPGLMAKFQSSPGDMGAAFRLYRDLDAVLGVAQRGADTGAADWTTSAQELRDSLNQLGDWIETQGTANYAALQKPHATSAPTAAPKTTEPPAILIINDANGTSPAKPKTKPKPCCR